MAEELGRVTTGYQHWLTRQPLSVNTRRAYLGRVRQYCAYLAARVNDYGNPLGDPHGRDYAIRDFKSHLKKSCKAKPVLGQSDARRPGQSLPVPWTGKGQCAAGGFAKGSTEGTGARRAEAVYAGSRTMHVDP